jgi:hypothetical protein
MTLTDRAEEILETLWIEIVEREKDACDVSILKDDITIKELKESGLVKLKDYQLRLTRKGREEARSCIRRHRLAERMFVDVLDLKGSIKGWTTMSVPSSDTRRPAPMESRFHRGTVAGNWQRHRKR